jgi:hypothetical protein
MNQDISNHVESLLPQFAIKSDIQLQEEVGADVDAGLITGEFGLTEGQRIRDFVCNTQNKRLIEEAISTGNVVTVVTALLAIFNVTATVPSALIALACLLIRIGLNQYCTGYNPST